MASAPFRVVGFGAEPLAVLIALLKRLIQSKTFGYFSFDTKAGGTAPFNPSTQWKGQMASSERMSVLK